MTEIEDGLGISEHRHIQRATAYRLNVHIGAL